jgi:hypothetical protein
MQFFIEKMRSYFFVKNDEKFNFFFDKRYVPVSKKHSIVDKTVGILKHFGESTKKSILKNLNKIKHSEKQTKIENSFFVQNLLAYETDFIHFEQILKNYIKEIEEIVDHFSQKNIHTIFFEEDLKNIDFYQDLFIFQEACRKSVDQEKTYLFFLENDTLVNLQDMRKDLFCAITQIKEKLKKFEHFEKIKNDIDDKNYEYQNDEFQKNFDTFLKEIKRFANQYDENLKFVMKNFLNESSDLDIVKTKF